MKLKCESNSRGLTLFKHKKIEIVEHEEIGIMHVCCEQMQKALKNYTNKRGDDVTSLFYNKCFKKPFLSIPTHHYYHYDETLCDWEKMNYCPFCGKKIDSVIEL